MPGPVVWSAGDATRPRPSRWGTPRWESRRRSGSSFRDRRRAWWPVVVAGRFSEIAVHLLVGSVAWRGLDLATRATRMGVRNANIG